MSRRHGWSGVTNEMDVLRRLLGEGGPLVVFVHGIAGIGKSALVEAFGVEARAVGATVLRLDCRAIEPTERGFLAALEAKTGGRAEPPPRRPRPGWTDSVNGSCSFSTRMSSLGCSIRGCAKTFVPALSDRIRLVLSGREPPMTGWPSTLGGLFRGLPLENLDRAAAEDLLKQAGVDDGDADRIYRLARGHPLSLRLAASALAERPEVSLEAVTVKAIVEGLTDLYLGGLDPKTRQALDAASVVRRATRSVLAAMLPETAPQDAFDRLRTLPFVELGDDGLVIHDTVRESIAALLRASDPARSKRYRAAAWRQLREEAAHAPHHEMWRYTADLLYILENPIVREAFFPTTDHLYSAEDARPDDGPAIAEIARRHMPPASASVIEAWWRLAPEAFRVLRDRLETVAGFYTVCEIDRVSHRLVEEDLFLAQVLGASPAASCATRPTRPVQPSLAVSRSRGGAISGAGRQLARHQAPVHGDAADAPADLFDRPGRRHVRPDGGAARVSSCFRAIPSSSMACRTTPRRMISVRRRSTAGWPGSSPRSSRSRTTRSWISFSISSSWTGGGSTSRSSSST